MKLKEKESTNNKMVPAAETHIEGKPQSHKALMPPPLQLAQAPIQMSPGDGEYSSFDAYGKNSYVYEGGASHQKTILQLVELSELDASLEINKIKDSTQLYKLKSALNTLPKPKKNIQKKLSSLNLMLMSRINTLKALNEQDASDEKINQQDEQSISSNWVKADASHVHFKHISGQGLFSNTNLTTKIREVREKTSQHNWGSTGYDLYIPYSIQKAKYWYPVILDPVLYIDVDVSKKEDFKSQSAFEPYYQEYKVLVNKYGDKEKALQEFAEKHTIDGVTTDLPNTQDATIFHEAGHVKQFQDYYQQVMTSFLSEINRDLKSYKGSDPNEKFIQLATQMFRGFSSDEHDTEHTKIVFNEIKAMIDIYEKMDPDKAYAEHDAFGTIRNEIKKK